MNDSAPAWDSDPQNEADIPQHSKPHTKSSNHVNEAKSIPKPINNDDNDHHNPHPKAINGKKEI